MFGDFLNIIEPFSAFDAWLNDARETEPNDPNAMALATVDASGLPDVRMVLLKGHDARGFAFFTNLESAKGRELQETPKAALNFHWKSRRRQVRIRGLVERVSDGEADAYYNSRHPVSRIGAWASQQSRPLASRDELEKAVAELELKFGDGPIPRPPYWGGFRLIPNQIEFWQDGPYRLHDRFLFRRDSQEAAWDKQRLFP
jgi:pyridoxamine 5'-phosphate oxidase